jgi:hypothetical protein
MEVHKRENDFNIDQIFEEEFGSREILLPLPNSPDDLKSFLIILKEIMKVRLELNKIIREKVK